MGMFSSKTKDLAKAYGVTPEALPRKLKQEQRERDARAAQLARGRAHAAGKSCGGHCCKR